MIWFLHHHDRPNQGDALSGPYRYFDFGEHNKLSWDKDILQPRLKIKTNDTVIMGGGIFFTKNKPRLSEIVKKSKHFIGWGIGLDPRIDIAEQIPNFTLLGTREKKLQPYTPSR